LQPLKNGARAYALLREVMKRTGKAGIAKVVIRSRQHLATLLVDGSLLILNLLRFAHELREPSGLEVPQDGGKTGSKQELKMAEQLVESMTNAWKPEKYRDEYRQDLLELIDKKVKSGRTKSVEPAAGESKPKGPAKVIDIMHLLRQSVDEARKQDQSSRRRKAS
jgi:DNA end-binding protein Ku